jgi:hypothetical protein
MKYRIKPRWGAHTNMLGKTQQYYVQFRTKWWKKWEFVRRPRFNDETPYEYKSVWYSKRGAQAYINQEKKRLNK